MICKNARRCLANYQKKTLQFLSLYGMGIAAV